MGDAGRAARIIVFVPPSSVTLGPEQAVANRRRSVLLLAAPPVVLVLLGLLVGALAGGLAVVAAIALLLGAGLSVAVFMASDRIVLGMTHAFPASGSGYARYHNLVEGLCVSAGLPKPDL